MKRRERPELLGDDQRRMVGEHYTTGAHSNRGGPGGHVRNYHCRRRTRDTRDTVVLREPEPVVAPPLCMLGEVQRIAERLRRVTSLHDRSKVQH
jgi:hypothetical protein